MSTTLEILAATERRLQDSVETCAELRAQLAQTERERDNLKLAYDRFDAPFLEWVQSYLDAGRWAGHSLLDAVKTELLERDVQLDAARAQVQRLREALKTTPTFHEEKSLLQCKTDDCQTYTTWRDVAGIAICFHHQNIEYGIWTRRQSDALHDTEPHGEPEVKP